LAKEKLPIFGMLQRGGQVVIRMLENVQRVTIAPVIRGAIAAGNVIYTDEYDIYNRLSEWGYTHHTVCHARGEYARDDETGMGSVRSTSTRRRGSGRCCGGGPPESSLSLRHVDRAVRHIGRRDPGRRDRGVPLRLRRGRRSMVECCLRLRHPVYHAA
jgi:transposase